MLALDHRGSFKKLMNPENPDSVSDEEVVKLKSEIINSISDQFSGLLIDEAYGLEAYPSHIKPFLLPLEKSGYIESSGEKITELEFRVTQLLVYGAKGAKILIYFNPNVESAKKQIETSQKVIEECKQSDFPLFLEPVTYTLEGKTHTQDPELVLETLKMFLDNNAVPSVFKVEYPGNRESCRRITEMLGDTPWILLTNPDKFEDFEEHLKQATKEGCKGFLAGRAVWQEVCSLKGEEKNEFLTKILPERFRRISQISRGEH